MKPSPSPALPQRNARALMSVMAVFALSACSTSSPEGVAGIAPVAMPLPRPENPAPLTEWTAHGLDFAETRFSPIDQIDSDNVGRLGVAWSWEIPRAGARLEATPLISDGVLYATGPRSYVYAVDARTGEEIWHWDPAIPDESEGGPSACCGDVNRGVALYNDKIIVGLLDGRLVAFNKANGDIEWVQQTTPPGDYSITGAPRIAGDKVIIGNGGAEYGVRGYVTGYDADTGEQRWRFETDGNVFSSPAVVDGMVYVNAGYSFLGSRGGNVLLAFGMD